MAVSKVHLTGHIDVPASMLAEVMLEFEVHIRLTLAEPGCEKFAVTPCVKVDRRFLVDEIFTDREAFEHHQVRARSSSWGRLTRSFERHFDIEFPHK